MRRGEGGEEGEGEADLRLKSNNPTLKGGKIVLWGTFETPVGFSMGILSSGVEKQTSRRKNVPHMRD